MTDQQEPDLQKTVQQPAAFSLARVLITLICIGVGLYGLYIAASAFNMAREPNEAETTAQSQTTTAEPMTEQEQRLRMQGVWVFAEPINTQIDAFPYEWMRWEIRADGTIVECNARPVDDNWGTCQTIQATPLTDKYTDTGQRWYGIRLAGTTRVGIYIPEQDIIRVYQRPAYDTTAVMRRGDKHPFSK